MAGASWENLRRYRQLFSLLLLIFYCIPVSHGIDMDICKERSCYPATGNLLIGRENRLSATSTCGLRQPERYCVISHLEERKKCFQCYSVDPWRPGREGGRSHRIQNVVSERFENRNKKWWQSESGVQNVSIRLDLEAEFHFTHLVMTFRSFRPAAMVIERSSDFGKTWKVYRYFAYDCAESFPAVAAGAPKKHTDVICDSRYSYVEPSSMGEVVFKVLSPHIPLGDPYSADIQDLLRVTNIRINFTRLHTLGDNLLDNRPEIAEKYYYAIYDMVVRGSCSCYGHASRCIPIQSDGITFAQDVRPDMVHGRCECTHHTKGLNCEECEDFYNDVPWGPAVDKNINACRRCNCNNHATRCHFDRAVYEASGYVSGGVCDDCMHNTMGKNCEQCKPYFYREPGREISDPYVCRACECDLRGSLNQGICDSETDPARNLIAGRCHCKTHVDGERCDRCKNGFWNLDQDNQEGCTPCTCYLLGTVGNEGCNKRTGECSCKRLVTGDNCDRCLPEHWGLGDSPEGCKPCDCDLGGAYDNQCDVVTGQCRCRRHFSGRRCDEPESGYFCANLDFYTYEAEDAKLDGPTRIELREPYADGYRTWTGPGFARAREGSTLTFDASNIVLAMKYHVIIRFESHLPAVWQNVQVSVIRPENPRSDGPCASSPPQNDNLRATFNPGGRYAEIHPAVCLEPGVRYQIKLSLGEYQSGFPDRSASVLVDSIVLVPPTDILSAFADGSELATYRRHEYNQHQCRHQILDLTPLDRLSDVCRRYICPLAASILDSAIECNCSQTGSVSGICAGQGGQCQCKPNVAGRRCDFCAPGTYGFGPQGCSACECSSVGSLDNFCDLGTGQCKCRDGVYGRQCDLCQPGFWGFPDCRPCECNGHAEICSQETGACIECRDRTTGHYCDRCQEGWYGDPRRGVDIPCRECPCPGISTSGFQHADSCYLDHQSKNVICNCRIGYEGTRCDKCSVNYWGNPNEVGGTCEKCDCSGNIDFTVPESCDARTGKCLKCLYNTEGFKCEHCKPGFYGDAKIQSCQKCVCNSLGTNQTGPPCDRATGQCPCLPNVIGLRCDACAPNHWKLDSGAGCDACNCDPTGVITGPDGQPVLQCNVLDGQCSCKIGRGGRTCSECENFFWGDPKVECKACECNRIGSSSLQCHRENGTCPCFPGSGGPKCDQCARGYKGTWPYCEACGECFQSWDRILQGLKEETARLVAQASGVEDTGITSVYDAEFKEMEKQLTDVQQQLNTANISRQDVDYLREQIKKLEKDIKDAQTRMNTVDQRVLDTITRVSRAEVSLDSLRKDADKLAATTKELEENTTTLREADVEGAYNVTREAAGASAAAQRKADATEGLIGQSETIRRLTNEKLASNQGDFEAQFKENEAALSNLAVQVDEVSNRIPNLNEMVCGAKGDPCDDICGGAGCGKCGGPSCGEGAVTKSEQALQYSQEANEKLNKKQAEAHELLQRVRQAQSDSEKSLLDARQAYETALSVSQQANQTRQSLEELHERISNFLSEPHTTPAEIRTLAEEVMNTTIPLNPTEITELARKIREHLGKLTNINVILSETRANLTIAEALKNKADQAKLRAESILNTTQAVIEALNKAGEAQDKAEKAIKTANADIESAQTDLHTISNETASAEKAASESTEALKNLKEDLAAVEFGYFQIGKDVNRSVTVADQAKQKAQAAQENRAQLTTLYNQATTLLTERTGASQDTQTRAEESKRKATNLLAKTLKHMDEIEQLRKATDSDQVRLEIYQKNIQAEDLQKRLNDAIKAINDYNILSEKCECDTGVTDPLKFPQKCPLASPRRK